MVSPHVEYGGYGTLTGRLGYADDRWLFYAKGGLALANIENTAGAFTGGDIDPSDFTSLDETRAGWTLGVGVEYAFQRDLSMKIEYLYMDFGADRSSNFDGDRLRARERHPHDQGRPELQFAAHLSSR